MSRTVLLSMPGSTRSVARTIHARCPRSLAIQIASVIRSFARNRGVGVSAVDYEVVA